MNSTEMKKFSVTGLIKLTRHAGASFRLVTHVPKIRVYVKFDPQKGWLAQAGHEYCNYTVTVIA
jgi:hypothetical protein